MDYSLSIIQILFFLHRFFFFSFLYIYSEIDNTSINWGTKLQPVISHSTSHLHVLLDMGYLHEHDHHYQTIVLYNRNPVEVQMTVFSSKVPNIHAFPIYRAQLVNQTISSIGTPSCNTFLFHSSFFRFHFTTS